MKLHPLLFRLKFTCAAFYIVAFANSYACTIEQNRFAPNIEIKVKQWEVCDIDVTVPAANPDEAATFELAARFTQNSGQTIEATAFQLADGNYRLRFTPPSTGTWRFQLSSTHAQLDNATGTLQVEEAAAGRRGGVIIDPDDATRFTYENGERYFPIAFESDWLFALDADNPSDIPKTKQLVDSLAENGFNQVVLNVFAYDVNWAKDPGLEPEHEYGQPDVFPFKGTNEDPEHSQLNYEYFDRFDRVVDYLDQKGIVAHLMIYVWNKKVNWPEAGSPEDNQYFDYVAARYQAFPNLVWDISKEALGYGHTDVNYITDRIQRLRKADAYERLITVHDYGYCRRFPKQVDFVSVQLWLSELYSVMREVRKSIPKKPILNIEHGGYERGPYVVFEGNYTSPEVCLARAYQCVFAGTYPTHYWQGAAWNVIIPDVQSLAPDVRPKLEYYKHLADFINTHDVGELIAGERKSNAGFCLHNGSGKYIYYVPEECDYIGLTQGLKQFRGSSMTLTWYNPFSGTYSTPETKTIPQWPAAKTPQESGFQILIIEIEE